MNCRFSLEERRKRLRASKSLRRLRVELFEPRMMLHGDAVVGTIYGLISFIETRALYLDAELDTYASGVDLRLNELMTVNVPHRRCC